jgi:hypothetical protein
MALRIDETDALTYVAEAMRARLTTLATLQRVASGEADDLDAEEVASVMGLVNGRLVREADPDDLADDASEQMEQLPLCVEALTLYEIVLGTGGPDDRLVVEAEDGDIRGIVCRYSWDGSAERRLQGVDREVAEAFAHQVVPELG